MNIDKIISMIRDLREEGAMGMTTGSSGSVPGLSHLSNAAGPVAGTTGPLDGRLRIMQRLPREYRIPLSKASTKRKKNK
jgi:hypothetical protein